MRDGGNSGPCYGRAGRSVGAVAVVPALQQHGADDDQALEDVLGLGGQVVHDEDVGDGGEDEHSVDRVDEGAPAAAEEGHDALMAKQVLKKIDRVIIPLAITLYIFNFAGM